MSHITLSSMMLNNKVHPLVWVFKT
jgi:hypothetical protein